MVIEPPISLEKLQGREPIDINSNESILCL